MFQLFLILCIYQDSSCLPFDLSPLSDTINLNFSNIANLIAEVLILAYCTLIMVAVMTLWMLNLKEGFFLKKRFIFMALSLLLSFQRNAMISFADIIIIGSY